MVDQLVKLSQFLEKHLLLLLLTKPSHLSTKIRVLSSTKMADALSEAYSEYKGSAPDVSEFPILASKDSILSELDDLEKKVKPLLASKEDLLDTELNTLKTLAKLQYEVGDYAGCANILEEIRRSDEKDVWGEMMVSVLLGRKENLMNMIEGYQPECNDIKDKAWLLHISLFAAFPETPSFFIDLLSVTKFSNTVEIACPHLVRYLVAAVLLKKPTKLVEVLITFKDLLSQDVALEGFVEFIENYDSEKAMGLLNKFEEEVNNDYFLADLAGKLVSEAKRFLVYCQLKLRRTVDLKWVQSCLHDEPRKAVEDIANEYKFSTNDRSFKLIG